MKFDNLQVGDNVYVVQSTGVGGAWHRNLKFRKYFQFELTVESVTKTQFCAGGMRFKKSGAGYGDNDFVAYFLGDKCYHGFYITGRDESDEFEKYRNSCNFIQNVSYICKFVLDAKDFETALRAANLVWEAKLMCEPSK